MKMLDANEGLILLVLPLESIRRMLPKTFTYLPTEKKRRCVCVSGHVHSGSDVCTHNLGNGLALISGCIFVRRSPLFWWARGGQAAAETSHDYALLKRLKFTSDDWGEGERLEPWTGHHVIDACSPKKCCSESCGVVLESFGAISHRRQRRMDELLITD